ncbi:YncE family protein [Albibacterium profundi]|uniref:DUF5074 domain-containing protein n=1 Tax=Albibacterium profundi TaxID=3134906 RepID=A0ABV5CC65_9SPHI
MKSPQPSKTTCIIVFFMAFLLIGQSCKKDHQPLPSEKEEVEDADPDASIKGFYLLNEGNMNMNKASLDYMDLQAGEYHRNIYNEINPEITKGLGDVGNDMAVYGSKLYIIVNNSNKVEVLDKYTAKRIGQIDIINCRYITFGNGRAYVSAYLGSVGDPNAPNGMVAEIDTASLEITRRVEVGRQPEELAIVGERLYVANSGGYSPPNYESTISVIDLESFEEVKRIEVAPNLHRLKADSYGDLYVTSRGDYYETPSKIYVIDTGTESVKKEFEIAASQLLIDDDIAYIYSTEWSYITGENEIGYHMLDVKNEELLDRSFITDGTEQEITLPYGIAVNPETKDVYVTDAKDYVSPGTIYCFDKDGKLKWSTTTGDIPAHFAFIY